MLRLSFVVLALLCGLPTPVSAQSSAPQVAYKYDALGRLIEVRYPNGRIVTYSYDPSGNRRQVTTSG